jgi:hypothetical protein
MLCRAVLCRAVLYPADIIGTVPASLSALNQLRQLGLEFNFLSGSLSKEVVCPEGNRLNALLLRANNFTGPLDLRDCGNLTVVDVQVRQGSRLNEQAGKRQDDRRGPRHHPSSCAGKGCANP